MSCFSFVSYVPFVSILVKSFASHLMPYSIRHSQMIEHACPTRTR